MNGKIHEQAFLIGKRQALVGILTRPAAPASERRPAVVILNTGVIHRVGHHRMYVTMSRALARAGHVVLRFDFSNVGDSDARPDALPLVESCLADIREVLDWLEQRHQIAQVILVGLCSGADHALLYGHTDARVAGLVLMDPTIPATSRYYLHYIAQRLPQLRNWTSLVAGRSRLLKLWAKHLLHIVRPELSYRQITLQDLQFHTCLERTYQSTVEHRIHILAIFTADTTRQTYAGQMLDAFPSVLFGDLLTTELFPESDHLFSMEVDRTELIIKIARWTDSLGPTFSARKERIVDNGNAKRHLLGPRQKATCSGGGTAVDG